MTPACVAVIVTGVLVATAEVVTGNAPIDSPGGTVTVAGTPATAGWLLAGATDAPSAPGAGRSARRGSAGRR